MKTNPESIAFLRADNIVSSNLIYDGAILQLYRNKITNENQQEVYRELIHHQPAVAILAIDNEEKVILVKQYRAAVNRTIYEIPAGLLDMLNNDFEDPLTGAQRELEEETGYQAQNWTNLGTYYLSPGYLDEKLTFFLAQELHLVENPLAADDDEIIYLERFSRKELINLIDQGQIVDLKTMYAINYYLSMER